MVRLALILAAVQTARGFSISALPSLRSSALASSATLRTPAHSFGRIGARGMSMVAGTQPDTATQAESERIAGDRFIACNRFISRPSKAAAFEQRWAERKSSLVKMEGFRFFTLMRRVDKVGDKEWPQPDKTPDYMSLTVWDKKDNFQAWRSGPAFKDAHGGGTIGGIFSAIVGALTELKGAPKPAFFEAIAPITVDKASSAIVLTGRDITGKPIADGKEKLPAECFVSMNRMVAKPGKEGDLEKYWAERESTLAQYPGFVGFAFLRRDADGKKKGDFADDKFTHTTCTIWASQDYFSKWREAHYADWEKRQAKGESNGFKDFLAESPEPIYWEGTQVLSMDKGF